MSKTAKINIDGNHKTICASRYYYENSQNYTFLCPCCNCKMTIKSRWISEGYNSYYFSSNNHDKKNCTIYRESKSTTVFNEGTPIINHNIFSDSSQNNKKANSIEKASTIKDLKNNLEADEINKEFKIQTPRLNDVYDFIDYISNCSIDNDYINFGSKNQPNNKTINQILIRDDNFENYHSRNLTGIGILWGGIRCNQLKLGIKVSKDSIIIQEYLPYSKFKENIKPIIFELSFSSEETKEDFANQYFKFNPKSTVLIIVGNWEKQPNQNGYKIYKSKIGKKCYTFIDHEKNKEETTEMISLKED